MTRLTVLNGNVLNSFRKNLKARLKWVMYEAWEQLFVLI